MTDYLVYDVFTDTPLGGNPLAIVPNAVDLPDDMLLKITREFNLSETVFLYPPEAGGIAKARIFTPGGEVPFAGHPIVGTCVMLSEAGVGEQFVLEVGAGEIEITAKEGQASFTNTAPLERLAEPEIALVARALGTPESTIVGQPVMASAGLPFTFTELTDREALSDLTLDTAAFHEGHARHPSGFDFAQCAYVRDGNTVHARVFAPLDGIPEDPATGSAANALTALLAGDGALSLTIHQGDDMGRPSIIRTTARPGAVTVAGHAVRVMEGKLFL